MAEHGTPLPEHVLDSIRHNRVALKGPITTPVGAGFRSVNVALRQALGLYANVRPARSIKGLETRYENVDLVIVRENTEDLYAGIEHMVGRDAAESIKIITREASERIARYAFEYAVANGRHKVTAVHKANIMKLSDGLFLESCRTVAEDYAGRIEFEDRIVDNMCMQLVQKPELYDVLVLPNLYGDIVSDLPPASSAGWAWRPAPTSAPRRRSSSRSTGRRRSTPARTRRTRRRSSCRACSCSATSASRMPRNGSRRPCATSSPRAGRHLRPGRVGRDAAAFADADHRAAGRRRPDRLTRRSGAQRTEAQCCSATGAARGCWRGRSTASPGPRSGPFIVLHVIDIWLVGANPDAYDEMLAVYASPSAGSGRACWGRRSCTTRSTACGSSSWTSGPSLTRLPPPALVHQLGDVRGGRPARARTSS